MAGALWTGADIFLGFIVGPVWKYLDPAARRSMQSRLIPNTFLYMPILGLTTGTAGWYVAQWNGFTQAHSALFPWVVAAGIIALVLTVAGLGVMLPNSLRMLREIGEPEPNPDRILRLTMTNRRVAMVQGVFQLGIMVVMAYLTVAP